MSIQVTVRLPDDLVAFVDDCARAGASSRASVIAAAINRERRRAIAERDAAILAAAPFDDDDLDKLADYSARVSLDELA